MAAAAMAAADSPDQASQVFLVHEEAAEEAGVSLPAPQQQQPMGLAAATTLLVLLLTAAYLVWDARRRRRCSGQDRLHPRRRQRLLAEEQERLRRVEQEARRLAALRAQRFDPEEDKSKRTTVRSIPDADLLSGRQPFPSAEALPPTAAVTIDPSPPPGSSFGADPSAYMVCTPLDTMDELLTWAPPDPPALAPRTFIPPYRPPPRAVQHELRRWGRLLVCHDMKGGYHTDRHCFGPNCPWDNDGGGEGAAFRLYQWELIDVFVYFSHQFITVPPPGWTALCHRHGAKALGTFITEWEAGKEKCRRVFESRETVERCVEQMVAIALHHGFEGWLINIENEVDWEGGTELVVAFLELLTRRMHEAVPAADPEAASPALVLWYDSVTHDTGELKWQDGLNARNAPFFRACDGIFTNYCWDADEPARSAAHAAVPADPDSGASRRWDVYMGIDCFGRNTFGGGGYDCDKALRRIRQAGVSAALFAPGWVWEHEVERQRRRARGEVEEAEKGEGEEESAQAVSGHAAEAAAVAEEHEEWDWRRIEAEFEATQERFWAKIGAMWPRRPLPSDSTQPFLTNFGTGVGLHVWEGGIRVRHAFTAAGMGARADGAKDDTGPGASSDARPWYNLAMQDALPLALTHCSRAHVKQPAPASTGGGRRSGRVREDEEDDVTTAAAAAAASPCLPTALGARISYRIAYRGGSSLCIEGLLHPGAGATRATLPLFQLDCPAPAAALEVGVAYKAPHSTAEDDFALELVLQGQEASRAAAAAVLEEGSSSETVGGLGRLPAVLNATSITTHVILRPFEKEGEATGGGRSSSHSGGSVSSGGGGWASRRVGKVLERSKGGKRTRKLFVAPVLDIEEVAAPPPPGAAKGLIMTSAQALAAAVGAAPQQEQQQRRGAVEGVVERLYDAAALEAFPWRRRLFRVRDLALEGARIKELRLVCLKKKEAGEGGGEAAPAAAPLPLPYCLFLGELSIGLHTRQPAASHPKRPPPRPSSLLLSPLDGSPVLTCRSLALHLAHWDPTTRRLSGQLAWAWDWARAAAAAEEEGGPCDPASLLADTAVLLFAPTCPPIWVGRALGSVTAFALSMAVPAGQGEGPVRLVLQPRDRVGGVLPLCACPSLMVALKAEQCLTYGREGGRKM